jgi:TatA/E family protein of Tat protein translocase
LKALPVLLILDSLGTSELLLILAVALIFFGPRKLPQISKQIGKSLSEFRKASDDFKSTWAREVALESDSKPEPSLWQQIMADPEAGTVERSSVVHSTVAEPQFQTPIESTPEPLPQNPEPVGLPVETKSATSEPARKSDWL